MSPLQPKQIRGSLKLAMESLNLAKDYLDQCIAAALDGGLNELGEEVQLAENGNVVLMLRSNGTLVEVEPDPMYEDCVDSSIDKNKYTPRSTLDIVKNNHYDVNDCVTRLFEFCESWRKTALHKQNQLENGGMLERIVVVTSDQHWPTTKKALPPKRS